MAVTTRSGPGTASPPADSPPRHDGADGAFRAADEANRLGQEAVPGAFLARQLTVLLAPRHLGFGAAVEARDFFSAETNGGAQAIRGRVPASDDGDLASHGRPPRHPRRENRGID